MKKWISLYEKEPPEMTYEKWQLEYSDANILFINDLKHMFTGFFYEGCFYDGDLADAMKHKCWCDDVTHWMPLPKPPK